MVVADLVVVEEVEVVVVVEAAVVSSTRICKAGMVGTHCKRKNSSGK